MSKMLTISLVTYHPDLELLSGTLVSLHKAVEWAGISASLKLLDNSQRVSERLSLAWVNKFWHGSFELVLSGKNAGFGAAHNLSLEHSDHYHVIVNPDIEIAEDALEKAIVFMENTLNVVCLPPMRHGMGALFSACASVIQRCWILFCVGLHLDGSKEHLMVGYPDMRCPISSMAKMCYGILSLSVVVLCCFAQMFCSSSEGLTLASSSILKILTSVCGQERSAGLLMSLR